MSKKIIKNTIIFIVIAIYFASDILIREVGNLDELWNYNFANNIANGLIPYKDFNMVVTPLLSIIGGIALNIFGKELVVIRILNIILNTTIIFMMYKIMEQLKIKKFISITLLIFLTFVFSQFAMFDYNFAVGLVSLIIVYSEIKNKENNNISYQIIIGTLAGISIILKQSTGIVITLVLLLYQLLEVRNKQELKQYLKKLSLKTIGVMIPVGIMVIYLITNNAFFEFIDYCILGISTFTNKVSYISIFTGDTNIVLKIISLIPITLIPLCIMYTKYKEKDALILLVFGIATLSVMYPISDGMHIISGIFVAILGLGYILNKIIKEDIKLLEKLEYLIITILVIYSIINSIQIYINSNKITELEHYKGLIMEQSLIEHISEIDNYIKNNKKTVYILDPSAAYYMIPLNKYNKDYDMFNLGNLGSKGEQGQIEKLKTEQGHIEILIKNENYEINWQNPTKVINWVKENMQKTGQIGQIEKFDIYK